MDDLVQREGLYYKKFTEVPFTGEITGQMLQGQFESGKEEGSQVWYHDNGQLFGKGDYKNGKREGSWVFYNDKGQKNLTGDKIGTTVLHEGSGTYKNDVKVD